MKQKHYIILVFGLALIMVSIFGIIRIKRFLQIDACLDKGGKWDYNLNKCEEYYKINSTNYTDFIWQTDYDSLRNREVLSKGKLLDSIGQSPQELIDLLNRRKPECKLELVSIDQDTIAVHIINDEFLSERMGTTGAYCYLGETVFTLTENKSLKYVRIEMDYGSHAGPGVYDRTSFVDLIINE